MYQKQDLNKNTTKNSFQKILLKLIYVMSLFTVHYVSASTQTEDLRQLLQLTEYIGVDYSSAVDSGKVIDNGEFQEMLEFSTIIFEKSTTIMGDEQEIVGLSNSLKNAVEKKQSSKNIQALTTELNIVIR